MTILILITLFYPLTKHRRMQEVQTAASTLFLSIGISELITQMVKAFVGRLRPNFYAMCGFDTMTKTCTSSVAYIKEARQSFPSGHSSLSFQGMVIVALFLVARIGLSKYYMTAASTSMIDMGTINNKMDYGAVSKNNASFLSWSTIYGLRKKQIQTLASILIPISYAVFVATTRLVDYWHHPSDVVAGVIIGIGSGFIAYHIFYPVVFSMNAGIPYRCLLS